MKKVLKRFFFHVYKMKITFLECFSSLQNEKKHVFEAIFMFTKWKTRFWSVFHVYKMKKYGVEAFFMFRKLSETLFKSRTKIHQMLAAMTSLLFFSVLIGFRWVCWKWICGGNPEDYEVEEIYFRTSLFWRPESNSCRKVY